MRFLTILLLETLAFFSAEALKKRQIQQKQHPSYCAMHRMICHSYCRPVSVNLGSPKPIDGCTSDSHCASDEKCCKSACGCTYKCVKTLEKPGFGQP